VAISFNLRVPAIHLAFVDNQFGINVEVSIENRIPDNIRAASSRGNY
jgi:hypothetical protein